jgi:SAM-dependent methyltransferase
VRELLPDFRPSGNAAVNPVLYDVENRACDPEGLVLAALRVIAPWDGVTLVDLGCGTGYWLEQYTGEAAEVIGIEPDPSLLERAGLNAGGARVLAGSAEHLPLPDDSVDVVHARFAYFFPPGCDAGLAEVRRVLRASGRLVVVDNDYRNGDFAALLAGSPYAAAQGQGNSTDAWWLARGATRTEVMSEWRFAQRSDLVAVMGMEFPRDIAEAWLAAHPDVLGLSYGYVLFSVGPGQGFNHAG